MQEFLRETPFPHNILCTPFFIAPESDHWQPLSVTNLLTHLNSLTNCCLIDLIDVTLACEDAIPKLVEVVSVDDVDDKKNVDDSLVQMFGH